jgi:hypothetical protein
MLYHPSLSHQLSAARERDALATAARARSTREGRTA